jgi:putative endonuclease
MAADYYVYLVRCSDGSFYCGIAKDVAARVIQHNKGTGSRYVRSRSPCALAAQSEAMPKREALRSEALIKKLPRLQKLPVVRSLINGVRMRGYHTAMLRRSLDRDRRH